MTLQELWLGYGHGGGRTTLGVGGPGNKVLLLGSQSDDLARTVALSAKESGMRPVVLDLNGLLASSLSGHFETFDYRAFLYDSFRLGEPEAWHSQLAAAAYTVALDLSSEEEAIVNSAMQVVASEGTMLSPISLYDVMGKVDGFRGFYVDRLSGRIGALKLFDAVDDQSFDRLLRGDIVLDFHSAPYPQAAELAAALFLAKAVTMEHAKGLDGGLLIMNEAHRLFRSSPRPLHSNRLLSHLVGMSAANVLASSHPAHTSPLLLQSFPVRVYSSDAWHSRPRRAGRVLPGTFVLDDLRDGRSEPFVPRRVMAKAADYVAGRPGRYPAPELAARLLEEIDRFQFSTPESIVQYVAPEFLPADVTTTLASLEKQACIIVEPKDSGSGRVFSYTLTDKGRKLLKELRA